MPILEPELVDFVEIKCYATIGFSNAYWQMPLVSKLYASCGLISLQGVFTSKSVLHYLMNATSHFQAQLPHFYGVHNCFKFWQINFILYAKEMNVLNGILDEFFC